jgi:molybdopterin-guanine dinucleotide biosynthesis protein A
MARRELTGVLLVGGASRRFGSAKALARYKGTTLSEHAWGVLGAACQQRLAFGKARDELALPFPVHDDGVPVRAPLAGIVGALRAAENDVCVFLPVDVPYATPELLRELGEACRDAAVPTGSPLPGAYSRGALPVLERRLAAGELTLRDALSELETVTVEVDRSLLANVNAPEELAALSVLGSARQRGGTMLAEHPLTLPAGADEGNADTEPVLDEVDVAPGLLR